MLVFAPITALQMAPSGKLLVAPQEAPERNSVPSEPGAQPVAQDSGPQAQALKVALPGPCLGALQSKGSVPEARSPMEDSSSSLVHTGEIAEAKILQPHLGKEGSPSQLGVKPGPARRGSASWGEGLATAHCGGILFGAKTSAREGGPGSSLTLPKARASSTPWDSIQVAKRHHSQPQVGRGHFDPVVNIEVGALAALHPSVLSKLKPPAELREEPEKMEMEEPPPTGKEEGENLKASGPELEKEELGNKPPTPPLHRFPSWVRGNLEVGQMGRASNKPTVH